jgi:streptogramin lyase
MRTAGIAVASDGFIWTTEWTHSAAAGIDSRLSRTSSDGSQYDFVSVSVLGLPRQLVTIGADVYFTVGSGLACASLNTKRVDFFAFPLESPWATLEATAIARDPDDGLWIGVAGGRGYLAHFQPRDASWSTIELDGGSPVACIVDAERSVWFTDFMESQLGRVMEDGSCQTWHWPGRPHGIATTLNGELWITEFDGNCVTRVDATSVVAVERSQLPHSSSQPLSLAADAAGRLWFAEQVGRVGCLSEHAHTASGNVTDVDVPEPATRLRDCAVTAPTIRAVPPDRAPIRVSYSAHGSFHTPAAELTIWRYMDFAKLISMLDSQSLFFSRLDGLPDRFEGSVPRRSPDLRTLDTDGDGTDSVLRFMSVHRNFRSRALVNCWHTSEYESMAMWDAYSFAGGIAITSTVGQLIDSIDCPFVDERQTVGLPDGPKAPMFVGLVHYIDYESGAVLRSTALDYLTLKRQSFEHERELRAVVLPAQPILGGQQVECDLGRLVNEIYVSPLAPAWFRESVQAVVDRFGMSRTVRQSDLDQDPVL